MGLCELAHGDRYELRDRGHDQPTVEGQTSADAEIVAICGSLWKPYEKLRVFPGTLCCPASSPELK